MAVAALFDGAARQRTGTGTQNQAGRARLVAITATADFAASKPPAIAPRIVPAVLAHAGLDLTLLIDKDVNAQQGEQFAQAIGAETAAMGWRPDRVTIRDTSSPSFMLSVLRDLKRGRSVLVYIDANKGLRPSSERNEENLAAIPFLGHELLSQRGIVALSARSGAPLRSILATRDDLDCGPYRFSIAPIDVADDSEASACAKLWQPLEAAIRIDVQPWEALRYANQYINFAPRSVAKSRTGASEANAFNHFRFRVIEFEDDDTYLYDRFARRLRKVSGRLAALLRHVSVAETGRGSDEIAATPEEHAEMISMDLLT
ncbi:hypothetical protein [Sphingomonas sp. SUN039]|uniref:hypothetical protein n=1 Tax=Sphingomonas sp. SUN039 TaxID=2937787 RepID=UPI0021644CB2|nr:hypothetical protein [Sphingomonas sp. SUN039]UVO55978.1 hypothetical protein M0209_15000 [Sphingomonas sp. SUN039]